MYWSGIFPPQYIPIEHIKTRNIEFSILYFSNRINKSVLKWIQLFLETLIDRKPFILKTFHNLNPKIQIQ
ncbi:hypothetical protein EGI22_22095 [Lacihabitans sp. LS3-19]|nr:hypothetical protein [Lacihabitans sp. LS3-19]